MSTEGQRTSAAMASLAACLREVRHDLAVLADRADHVGDAVADGRPLLTVVAGEPRPLIITRMTELLEQLAASAAEVRRAEAHQLRAEGLSHERIAALFGVTRQRVAALLAPPPGGRGSAR